MVPEISDKYLMHAQSCQFNKNNWGILLKFQSICRRVEIILIVLWVFNQVIQNKTGQEWQQINPINSIFAKMYVSSSSLLPSRLLGTRTKFSYRDSSHSCTQYCVTHKSDKEYKYESFILRIFTGKDGQINLEGWLKKQNKKTLSPLLKFLWWLSITQRIKHKLLNLTFKALENLDLLSIRLNLCVSQLSQMNLSVVKVESQK